MHRKHLGAVLILAVSLIAGPTAGAAAHPISPAYLASVDGSRAPVQTVKQTTANLNLRKNASMSAGSWGLVPKGTALTILKVSGIWHQVTFKSKTGWVSGRYLTTHSTTRVYNYTKGYTTLKTKAVSSSASVLSVHRRTKVEVISKSGPWAKVKVSGRTGFVPRTAVESAKPSAVYRWVNGNQKAYATASASSKGLATLASNTKVEWLRTSGAWQQVRATAGVLWVPSKFISSKAIVPSAIDIKPAAPDLPAPILSADVPTVPNYSSPRWSVSAVNVRAGAGTSFQSQGVIPAGEKVLHGRSVSGWANVQTSKGIGWVSEQYLSAVEYKPVVLQYRWANGSLSLRSGNSIASTVLGVVPAGEKVAYLQSLDGWAKILSSKGNGWVEEGYLSNVEYKPVDAQFRWASGNVNLRSSNSIAGMVLGVVPAGEKVTFLESNNGWARVVSSKGVGWMSESLLSKIMVSRLQPDTVAVMEAVRARYQAYISSIGGIRSGSVGHSTGKAADIMIRDYKNLVSVAKGNEMAQFLINNRQALGIHYLIWQDKIWLGPTKGWEEYSKSGRYGQQFSGNWNDTTLHLDHIHVETYGNSGSGAPLAK